MAGPENKAGASGQSPNLWRLRVDRHRLERAVVIEVAGRVGRASAGVLAAELEEVIDRGDKFIVVDLASVDYISSPGLLALEAARDRIGTFHGRLALCSMGDAVRIALELAGLAGGFLVGQSRDEALRLLGTGA